MKKIRLPFPLKSEILLGRELLPSLGVLLRERTEPCRVLIVSDETVWGLYGEGVFASLSAAGFEPEKHLIACGEAEKSPENLRTLLGVLDERGFTRADRVLALGGGVVSDLAGLAASLWLRGIGFDICPTTLLAMADASVGGKTAIDLPGGKNRIGTFYQPAFVFCDLSVLNTLPAPLLNQGKAEILKAGILRDPALFRMIEKGEAPSEEMLARALRVKIRYVCRDERDHGLRAYLNLGHTFAHALEAASGYEIPHGEAVATGLCMAARYARSLGKMEKDVCARVEKAVCALGFAAHPAFPAGSPASFAASDKKRAGDRITLILPRRIGRCEKVSCSPDELEMIFRAAE